MDKKQLSQLDPKLKAVYDRVMNVANAAPPPPPSQITPPQVTPTPQAPAAATFDVVQAPPTTSSPTTAPFVTQALPSILTAPSIAPASTPIVQTSGPQTFKPEVLYNPQLGGATSSSTPPNSYQTMQSTVPTAPMHAGADHVGGGKTFMILFIILGLIFFVLYGFFWVQLFNIGIPPFS